MRTPLHPVLQWLLVVAFVAWFTILLVVIIGEDNPDMPLSIMDFFLIKIMAGCSVYTTYKAGAWCYYHDYFPAIVQAYIDTACEEEDDEI